jgi:hypothetical protein
MLKEHTRFFGSISACGSKAILVVLCWLARPRGAQSTFKAAFRSGHLLGEGYKVLRMSRSFEP